MRWEKETCLHSSIRHLYENLGQYMKQTGILGLTIFGILSGTYWENIPQDSTFYDYLSWEFLLLSFSGILYFSSIIVENTEQDSYKSLLKKKNRYKGYIERFENSHEENHDKFYELLRLQLELLGERLDFTSNDRVTLYKHDGDQFIMLERYSENPALAEKGRGTYPDNEGCIGHAWQHGSVYDSDFPNPETDWGRYVEYQQAEWSIDEETLEDMTMYSRLYAAYSIRTYRGHEPLAVIVFESENQDSFSEASFRDLMDDQDEEDRLCDFLKNEPSSVPSPDLAAEEGF